MWEQTPEKIPTQGCKHRKTRQGTFLPGERKPLKGQSKNPYSSSGAHKLVQRDSLDQIWFQKAEKPKQRNHTEEPYS